MFIPLIFYYFNYFPDIHDGADNDGIKPYKNLLFYEKRKKIEQKYREKKKRADALQKKEYKVEKKISNFASFKEAISYKELEELDKLKKQLLILENQLRKYEQEEDDLHAILLSLY